MPGWGDGGEGFTSFNSGEGFRAIIVPCLITNVLLSFIVFEKFYNLPMHLNMCKITLHSLPYHKLNE